MARSGASLVNGGAANDISACGAGVSSANAAAGSMTRARTRSSASVLIEETLGRAGPADPLSDAGDQRRRFGRQRQSHGRAGTAAGLADDRDRAAVGVDQRLGDGQPQPRAAIDAGARLVGAVEALEQVGQVL